MLVAGGCQCRCVPRTALPSAHRRRMLATFANIAGILSLAPFGALPVPAIFIFHNFLV